MQHRKLRMAWSVFWGVAAVLLTALGCDSIHQRLIDNYILMAVDSDEQLSISHEEGSGIAIGRIGPVVTDAGCNAKYIVATVRPPGQPGTPPKYYYLEIEKDRGEGNQLQAVTGPLSKEEFEQAKKKLDLPAFSRHFDSLR